MHKRGLCRHTVTVRLSVHPSVCHVRELRQTNKNIFEFFSPSGSQAILAFSCQTGWRHSDGNPPNGRVECMWGRQKTRFWANIILASLHTGLQCYQPYESRSVKNKAATNGGKRRAEHSRRRPSSVVHTRRRRSVCDGLDVIRRRGGQTHPRHNPLGHNPRFLLP